MTFGLAAMVVRFSTRPTMANIGAKFHSLQTPVLRLAPSFPFTSLIRKTESSLPAAEGVGRQPMAESPGKLSECG